MDTIFFSESVSRECDYFNRFWRNPDETFELAETMIKSKTRVAVFCRDQSDQTDKYLITKWKKDTLMKYGSSLMPPGSSSTNPSLTFVSRVILTPDSVQIDLLKL